MGRREDPLVAEPNREALVRWEGKKNYIGILHFACAWVTWFASGTFDRQ
jgi:hypothetical protein